LLDENFDIKIADFGLATKLADENGRIIRLNDFVGTRGYMAPEILHLRYYIGEKVDIFSLGVVLFNLVTGSRPFHEA